MLETNIRYYRRRACEEMTAATRAVTPAARERRLQLVEVYLERLKAMNAPSPFQDSGPGLSIRSREHSAFSWPGSKRA